MNSEQIRLCNICIVKDDKKVLNYFNMELYRGEVLGIVGGYTSGKTSIMDVIEGKSLIGDGHILINGHDSKRKNVDWPRCKRFSKNYNLIENMTLWENILLNRKIDTFRDWIFDPKVERKRFKTFCQYYGIELDPDCMVNQLSDYYQLMVGILCAKYQKFDILLLEDFYQHFSRDEITGLRLLISKLKDEGMSFVISSLNVKVIEMFCDRMLFVWNGCNIYRADNPDKFYVIKQLSGETQSEISYPLGSKERECESENWKVFRISNLDIGLVDKFSIEFRSSDYVAIVDRDGEGTSVLLNRILTKDTRVVVLDIGKLDNVIEWMSPAENICIRIFDRIFDKGIISQKVLDFVTNQFVKWWGEDSITGKENCIGLTRGEKVALTLFGLKLARPQVVFFKGLLENTDEKMGKRILEALQEMRESGVAMCVCIAYWQFGDFAEKYILFDGGKIHYNVPYISTQSER